MSTLATTAPDDAVDDGAAATDSLDVRNASERPRRRRWGWWSHQGLSDEWVGRCRDRAGRRRTLMVVLTETKRVALVVPPGGVAVLDLLTVGSLRAVLREAVLALDDSGVERPHAWEVPVSSEHLDGVGARSTGRCWWSRLWCRRGRPADGGSDGTRSHNAPASAGVQPSAGVGAAPGAITGPSPAAADAPRGRGRHAA